MTLRSGTEPGTERVLVPGVADGEVLVLAEPLSLWGGLDVQTGTVIDRRHPQRGATLSGRIVVMPGGRGSSSSSSILAEAIRAGSAPAALILSTPDPILVLGAVVAAELYERSLPIVTAGETLYASLKTGHHAHLEAEEGDVVRLTTR